MYPHAVSHASTATDRESSRLRFTAWALLVWSMLYALPHLYWGLGGPEGHSVYKPSASQQAGWEAAHLFAFALITFAGLLGFALERCCLSSLERDARLRQLTVFTALASEQLQSSA